jgi:hypothetical protein
MKGVFEVNGKNDKVFSYPGDSGSIIFKRNRDATADVVGMIFGGGGRTTYGFPLQPIMDSFRCRLFFGLSKKARLSLQSR